MMNKEYRSKSLIDTKEIAKDLFEVLEPQDIVLLTGDFGAGKTCFVREVCVHFGLNYKCVTSPSYTIVNEYECLPKIVHMDTYRLKSDFEFDHLDLNYYLSQNSIVFIEWGEKVKHLIEGNYYNIMIQVQDNNERIFKISRKDHD